MYIAYSALSALVIPRQNAQPTVLRKKDSIKGKKV